MKKYILSALFLLCLAGLAPLAAASYDNNEFQRKSRAYTDLAAKSYDDGDYDAAVTYAQEAEKNAGLSAAFIEKMMVRADAEAVLLKAHTRLTWAKEKKADIYFASAFESATTALTSGDGLFASEDYAGAKQYAEQALEALSSVRETIPLPAFYKVNRWASNKDCFWNIAANPAVYGNPFLWRELYKANKKALPKPSNPDLMEPDMIIAIPSLKGEYREGTYDPAIKYESFKKQVK